MAVIKYKGRIIAEIYEGQRITLHTQDHELDGDLVIEGFNGGEAPQFATEVVTVTPTKATQIIGPSKADYISKAIVKPIPDEYIIPQGNLTLTANGTHNVTGYASVEVNVSGGSGNGVPIAITSEEEVNAIMANPAENVGKIYNYAGTLFTVAKESGA